MYVMLFFLLFVQGVDAGLTETVAQADAGQSFTSGGGFSTYYFQPEWQREAVDGYFLAAEAANETPVDGYYRNNRGYPDLTFAGYNYAVVIGGNFYKVSGTSASAPAIAGLLSNINAARLAIGKGSVGFINPALYANYTSFTNDITVGDNRCAANNICCSEGFFATTGWDPASGLGSVNYGKMHATFLALGSVGFKKPIPGTEPTEEPTRAPTFIPTSIDPTTKPTPKPTFTPTTAFYSSVQIHQVL
jgi:tripeptidyl-peptidase I